MMPAWAATSFCVRPSRTRRWESTPTIVDISAFTLLIYVIYAFSSTRRNQSSEHSAGQREGEPREQSPGAREVKVAIAPSLFDGDAVGRGYEGPNEDADPEEHRRAGEHGEDVA